jgi:hypothetical protein
MMGKEKEGVGDGIFVGNAENEDHDRTLQPAGRDSDL